MKIDAVQLSIIIVNYRVEKELTACITSIMQFRPKVTFEIIVVDNSTSDKLSRNLKIFPQVKYIKNSKNLGYGAAINIGSRMASGKYLLFLNPDTIVKKGAIDTLYSFLSSNPGVGIIAPLLLNSREEPYPLQGTDSFTFINAITVLSFVNKFLPNNSISNKFFHKNWDKKSIEEVDVVPGAASMISKDLFEKAGMFDEDFFLYFEEYDLAKRIKDLGYKSYIVSQAEVVHIREVSTKKMQDINKIFSRSRNLFFRKHYGSLFALIIRVISGIGKYEFLLGITLAVSVFLTLFRIRELMTFIGDQGWFYLSARDMLITGQIPLVGIASSHPWLHQGPFWTYLLAPFLWVFNFDPISGAFLTMILGILSVAGIFLVGSELFSKRVGLVAAFLYATSPLVVYYMRFPYHTSPIPLFVIILTYFLYKMIQGRASYLPWSMFVLAILYNFEIATVALGGVLLSVLIYLFFKNKLIFKQVLGKKILFSSLILFSVPLFPIILYDVRNGFPQTLRFAAWTLYRAGSLLGNSEQAFSFNKIISMFNFLFINFTKLIFAQNSLVSFLILIFLSIGVVYMLKKKVKSGAHKLVVLLILIPLILVVLNQVPSDAYLPIFFPTVILLLSLFLDFILNKKIMVVTMSIIIIILAGFNVNFMLRNNFLFDKSGNLFTLSERLKAANQILNISQKKDYNLKGIGPGSEFESFTMSYEYLTCWMGHGPLKKNVDLKIYISENSGIKILSKNK